MASASISHLPINDSIIAHKYKNRFILNATVKYLESCQTNKVTLEVSKNETMIFNEMIESKCKRIATMITHVHITGIEHDYLSTKLTNTIAEMSKQCMNVTKMTLEGAGMNSFIRNFDSGRYPYHSLTSSLHVAAKRNMNLTRIELIFNFYFLLTNEELVQLHTEFNEFEFVSQNSKSRSVIIERHRK